MTGYGYKYGNYYVQRNAEVADERCKYSTIK